MRGGIYRDDGVIRTATGRPPAGDATSWAYLTSEANGTVTMTVTDTPPETSPVSAGVVWRDDVHADETETGVTAGATSVTADAPVQGHARLDVAAAIVDVRCPNVDNNQGDLPWSSLSRNGGVFKGARAR